MASVANSPDMSRSGGFGGFRGAAAVVVVVIAALTALVAHPGPVMAIDSASGGLPNGLVVSQNPADWTPHVLEGRVNAITQVGDRIVVGGSFSRVRQAGSKEVFTRKNLFAFDAASGAVDRSFAPNPDGSVAALATASDAVFVGGRFGRIAGQPAGRLAKLDIATGRPSAGFRASVAGDVDDLVRNGGRLYVAGSLSAVNGTARSGLAAVSVDTGAVDPKVDVPFTNPRAGGLTVNRIAVRRDGSRLVALGSFTRVAGRERHQIAVLDLAGGTARVADWHTGGYAVQCAPTFHTYMRGVDISADGSFFVVVTTGGRARPTLCDTAVRWELDVNGSNLQPTWVDHTGGDTLTGVAVTDAAVYVGGHPRWMNNPYNNGTGIDATPGPGAVPRTGIAALDPVNGLPLSWNPGRNPRGVGVFAFLATPKGLWVGSDTENIGGDQHPRLALLPAAGGKNVPRPTPSRLPGVFYTAAPGGSVELFGQDFDGLRAGAAALTRTGINWSKARGAFLVDGNLYTGWNDGRIDVRRFGEGGLGAPRNLDLRACRSWPKPSSPWPS